MRTRITIVKAPGMAGGDLYLMGTRRDGSSCLRSNGNKASPDHEYYYLIEEWDREYPFGTYTTMHYTAFRTLDQAEMWKHVIEKVNDGTH